VAAAEKRALYLKMACVWSLANESAGSLVLSLNHRTPHVERRLNSSGSFATFAAMRRIAAERRPGSFSK
jgi:hypothetical protein